MDRLGAEEGEVITHPFITRAIEKSQKKVELYNFGIRKRLLEYDDVMNKQREVIYGRRNSILDTDDLDGMVHGLIDNVIYQVIDGYMPPDTLHDEWDIEGAAGELETIFLFRFDTSALSEKDRKEEQAIISHFRAEARKAFELRKSMIPEEIMLQLEKMIMLQSIDEKWMDNLRELDNLREGIHFRSYAQKDPLVEYKQEAFQMFSDMVDDIDKTVLWGLFHARVDSPEKTGRKQPRREVAMHRTVDAYADAHKPQETKPVQAAAPGGVIGPAGPGRNTQPLQREEPKVGRNDPCPCGSGKKYKKCCGRGD
jgi:preprotein translocase subunit SecA